MNTGVRSVSRIGLQKLMFILLVGAVTVVALTGCSGSTLEAQARFHTAVAQATATASRNGPRIQSGATAIPNSISAQATQIRRDFDFAGKQAEDRAFTTILVGWFMLFIIAGLTTLAVFLYAGRLRYRMSIEKQFIYSVQPNTNRRP